MKVLGVDPGKYGALALIECGLLVTVLDMPLSDAGSIDGRKLAQLVAQLKPDCAFLEKVGSRPGEGHKGAFSFGRNVGLVVGAIGAAGLIPTEVMPQEWQRAVGVRRGADGDIKSVSRAKAAKLFPTHAKLFARVKDDGRADASLIAQYGWTRVNEL